MNRPPLLILAGGKGTRLGELTKDIPKPMVDVHGKPFLYWLIEHYRRQGFTDIVVSTGYKAEVIENYDWPWRLEFLRDRITSSGPDDALNGFELNPWAWIVNGDTFIPDVLPDDSRPSYPILCVHNDIDAGAQLIGMSFGVSRIKPYPVSDFYDIGTPFGLGRFREYFKTHSLYVDSLHHNVMLSLQPNKSSENRDV